MLSKDPFYRPGTVDIPPEEIQDEVAPIDNLQQQPEDSIRNPKEDGEVQMEGGEPDSPEEDVYI